MVVVVVVDYCGIVVVHRFDMDTQCLVMHVDVVGRQRRKKKRRRAKNHRLQVLVVVVVVVMVGTGVVVRHV